jgi:hypothetical protein
MTMSNETTTSKRPTHSAYSVRDYTKNGERKADWTAIGVAWAHQDGEGFDIVLEALPVWCQKSAAGSRTHGRQAFGPGLRCES